MSDQFEKDALEIAIQSLTDKITGNNPAVSKDMIKVMSLINNRPNLVNVLSEEQIGQIVQGLIASKALELPTPVRKSKTPKITKNLDGSLDL